MSVVEGIGIYNVTQLAPQVRAYKPLAFKAVMQSRFARPGCEDLSRPEAGQ